MDRTAPPDGDVSRTTLLVAVSWTLASIALLFVLLRTYCRALIARNMWWDDWSIILTMVWAPPLLASSLFLKITYTAFVVWHALERTVWKIANIDPKLRAAKIWSLVLTSLWVVYAKRGGTRHIFYLPLDTQISTLKINWISQVFCVLWLKFCKIFVGFLIVRIGVPKKWLRNLLFFFMISQFILFSFCIIFLFAQCRPVTKLWNIVEEGSCWDPEILTAMTIIASSRFIHRFLLGC